MTSHQEKRFVRIGDVEMFLIETGRPDGPPLLVLHGGWATGQLNWSRHLSWLGQHYRVYLPDHRGHGRTADPRPMQTSYDTLASDMIGLCRNLGIDDKDLTVMGHSSGAAISLIMSIRAPDVVSRQILVSISLEPGVSDHHKTGMRDFFFTDDHRYPPKKSRYIWNRPLSAIALKHAHRAHNWYDLLQAAWPRWVTPLPITPADLTQVTAETLCVCGRKDEFIATQEVEKLANALPGPEPRLIAERDHMFVINHPGDLQEAIGPFLSIGD